MKRFSPWRSAFGVGLILSLNIPLDAQLAAKADTESRRKQASFLDRSHNGETLRFVVVLSRHGVRSPTATPAQYNIYSVAPWPEWDVPPGNLTTHGFELMREFAAEWRDYLCGLRPADSRDRKSTCRRAFSRMQCGSDRSAGRHKRPPLPP